MIHSHGFGTSVQEQFLIRLNKLTPIQKARWGKMSSTEMLTHMNDAFRICLGMKSAIDKSNFFWNKIAFPVAVYLLPGFPKNAATAPELNQRVQGSSPRDFYTELEFLKKMMDVFNEREETKMKPHPMFGKLTKEQWRDLLVKHLNHHLNQFGV
jgi:hypothetical protein